MGPLTMIRTACAAALLVLVGALPPAVAADVVIRIGWPEPTDTPAGQAVMLFQQLVQDGSDGAIEVQTFPSLQLGPIVEQIESVQVGTQEMMISTPAWFSRFYPTIDVLSLPYLVANWEEADRLIASDAFEDLVADAEAATGIRILGVFPLGFRHVINERGPIEEVADLEGLKIRLQNSPVQLATFRALGANPTSLPWDGVYQALQTGVVDGLEAPLPTLHAMKFHEVAGYISKTYHFFEPFLVYINSDFFDGLSAEHQALVQEAVAEASRQGLAEARERAEEAEAALQEAGASVNDVSPETIELLQEKVEPVYAEFGEDFEPHLSALREAARP